MARYSTTALLSLILAVVFLADLVVATLVNITVDDSDTQAITYIPTTAHWASSSPNQPCNSCLEHPTNASGQTWHDATYNSTNPLQNITQTATFIFDGSAIYVFGIISHNHNNTVRDMDIFFYIDDHMVGNFKDSPPANPDGGIVYDYNVVLYANPSISQPGSHNFTLQNGQIGGSSSLILFDYIIYTSDVADQTISNTQALTQTSVSTSPLASSASIPPSSSSSSAPTSSSFTSHSSSTAPEADDANSQPSSNATDSSSLYAHSVTVPGLPVPSSGSATSSVTETSASGSVRSDSKAPASNRTKTIIIASIVGVVGVSIILLAIFIFRYRHLSTTKHDQTKEVSLDEAWRTSYAEIFPSSRDEHPSAESPGAQATFQDEDIFLQERPWIGNEADSITPSSASEIVTLYTRDDSISIASFPASAGPLITHGSDTGDSDYHTMTSTDTRT
ncbi:hypothetical protein PHLCEN_2v381 [Hermanssonia centrifuga]|uniref:Uncharacterized protein n=1 Tax=Hermanssonia centrifuga TaxID=98765 RepID=A0A2R6S648_9APHY|nr:hypothetical protein PHLCEN_2v381 [Hermanssonia centrifuga]